MQLKLEFRINFFFLIFLLLVPGCTSTNNVKETVKSETKVEDKTINKVEIGWADPDTYTVKVISENIEKAKEKAKHQILQDIVKVRMVNESRFTDITKINAEFEQPLKNGKIINERKVGNELEIYFQIKDDGLKQKFEKK